MSDSDSHWRNQIKVFISIHIKDVETTLNNFFKDKFVIATQIFPIANFSEGFCNAVIYFKVPPASKE